LAEINWTRESEIWLKDIYDYIAADDAGAAAQTIIKISEKAQLSETIHDLGIDMNPNNPARFGFSYTIITVSPT